MPHVPSSRVNPPSAGSWQRLARRVGKCSPKRADWPEPFVPIAAGNFSHCTLGNVVRCL